MKFSVVTLFPKVLEQSLHGNFLKACEQEIIKLQVINPREFTSDVHQTVDDKPFGGGDGMLMKADPVQKALQQARAGEKARVIYLSPQGQPLTQKKVKALSQEKHLVLLCGRYAGVDERLIQSEVDEEISIGDYVLSGGELAALVLMDAVSRFVPGVLGHADSADKDSFSQGVLEASQFTRPANWNGWEVPAVLLSGNHKEIDKFQAQVALLQTQKKRSDLLRSVDVQALEKFWLGLTSSEKQSLGLQEFPFQVRGEMHLALVHHPMLDSQGDVVATNITNFDIHDCARACRVYGVKSYALVHPMQEQLQFVHRILDHWRVGTGAKYNPSRHRALEGVVTAPSVEELRRLVQPDLVIATHARPVPGVRTWACEELRAEVRTAGRKVLLLFGTGYGFPETEFPKYDGVLESLRGPYPDDFRHLSVRSAVSIYLDRLLAP